MSGNNEAFFPLAFFLLVFLPLPVLPERASAFEKNAHDALVGRAVSASNLDSFLKSEISIPGGISEEILGREVVDWIQDGSVSEDSPPSRVLRHFHDPTRPWTDAGFGGGSSSSVLWAQDPFQSASWQTARDRYYKALTLPTRTERDSSFAKMFWVLGHVVHLIQDAASPAHTREDPHPCIRGTINCDRFHVWADSQAGLSKIGNSGSLPFQKIDSG